MNKIVQEQLEKVKFADLTNYDLSNHTYFIKKRVDIKLQKDNYYLIKLSNNIRNNQILKNNWNNGIVPTQTYYKIDVCNIMGKMVKVNGVGYDYMNQLDLDDIFSGWLPIQEIEILSKL